MLIVTREGDRRRKLPPIIARRETDPDFVPLDGTPTECDRQGEGRGGLDGFSIHVAIGLRGTDRAHSRPRTAVPGGQPPRGRPKARPGCTHYS
jgi:hypothetical protein